MLPSCFQWKCEMLEWALVSRPSHRQKLSLIFLVYIRKTMNILIYIYIIFCLVFAKSIFMRRGYNLGFCCFGGFAPRIFEASLHWIRRAKESSEKREVSRRFWKFTSTNKWPKLVQDSASVWKKWDCSLAIHTSAYSKKSRFGNVWSLSQVLRCSARRTIHRTCFYKGMDKENRRINRQTSKAASQHYAWAPGWLLSLAGLITTTSIVTSLLLQRTLFGGVGTCDDPRYAL